MGIRLATSTVRRALFASCIHIEARRTAILSVTIAILQSQENLSTSKAVVSIRSLAFTTAKMAFLAFITNAIESPIAYTVLTIVCCIYVTGSTDFVDPE